MVRSIAEARGGFFQRVEASEFPAAGQGEVRSPKGRSPVFLGVRVVRSLVEWSGRGGEGVGVVGDEAVEGEVAVGVGGGGAEVAVGELVAGLSGEGEVDGDVGEGFFVGVDEACGERRRG
jgi:hypothetical protein